MDDEPPSLLVIVLDASLPLWRTREITRLHQDGNPSLKQPRVATFQETLEALLVFLESYLLMHRGNDVAFIAASRTGSRVLYPPPEFRAQGRSLPNGAVSSGDLQNCLVNGLRTLAADDGAAERGERPGTRLLPGPAMAKAMSQSLCYINRLKLEAAAVQARLLVLQGEADVAEHYNSIMNCIFSAQKAQVPVDCCVLAAGHSMFLQQAAYLSGGFYHSSSEPGLLPALLATFLPSASCRRYLSLRRQESIDFRAACFCHRRVVEVAYVCSVCLSVFCAFSPICSTCGTRAKPPQVVRRGR
ncbi:unnamed protein product [Phaeothamnion confervicola]